jgi:branched-chain amino acid transport system ATP-binding protein
MKIEVEKLRAGYGPLQVLDEVSLRADPGMCVAVIGPNGAGKSTLMNAIAGLVKPTGGRVLLDGRDVTGLAAHELVRLGIGLVPEGRHLFPSLTVMENLRMAQRAGRQRGGRTTVSEVISTFPVLGERAAVAAMRLSGGEQQMLAIGRTLMLAPRVILLDEPSIGLAPRLVREVMETVRQLASADVSVVVVEQNAKEALRITDYAYVLENGRIVREAPAGELLAHSDLRRDYLGV